ncbi:MAG: DMT family transporter, partial [Calditrichia bacterium]|nr:DMT family transporter [Calditrichia bacterium]
MKNTFLYIIPVLIWGSTWLVIKFQLGIVDPMVSVGYRFFLASIILLAYCKIKGFNLKYSAREHFFMALQGFFLFGVNYWLVYIAELEIASGLVAIVFSTIVFLNSVNGAIFLKSKINIKVISGGILGVIGVALLFKEELLSLNLSSTSLVALIFALISAYLASLGNIISAYNQ